MTFDFDMREAESPFVEAIWRTYSGKSNDPFISTAENRWEMVITRQYGKSNLVLRGPETRAKPAPVPEDAEIFGIVFKPGTFMPGLPVAKLTNSEIYLPEECHHSVYLIDNPVELPTFENADIFIDHLCKLDMLVYETLVDDILQNRTSDVSLRTMQRRFLRATGMTFGTFQQIERAKQALLLLEQGFPILDTVYEAGYADQPHLTRSLKRFIGRTPAEITPG